MPKSNNFSIYLLKAGITYQNALKDGHVLDGPIEASNISENIKLFLLDSIPKNPWWKDYWGIEKNLSQVLKGAIAFVDVDERCFALTFGHTSTNLKDDSYEYDFGVKTTLNSLDPQKLKSTDVLEPDNAKRSRIQSPVDSDLTFFDFDRDSSILKRLTGKVKEEYKDYFSSATGSSGIRISSKKSANSIIILLKKLYQIYQKNDYKDNFPTLQNISPVFDPTIIETLNTKLENVFSEKPPELVLTIPDIVDYSDDLNIRFSGGGKKHIMIYQDVYIDYYRLYLQENSVTDITISNLKKHQINLCDSDGKSYKSFSIFKSLLYDCEIDDKHYHLCDGSWYEVDKSYTDSLQSFLDPYFTQNSLFKEYNHDNEGAYNTSLPTLKGKTICMDTTSISPFGQSQVEPCDLYNVVDNASIFIHVKISTRSSTLSHLFNQGLNSCELLKVEKESREKFKNIISQNVHNSDDIEKYYEPYRVNNYSVIYAIITHKPEDKKSLNLPLFSRISLKRSINSFILMGVDVSVVFINDISERKKPKKKKNKRSN